MELEMYKYATLTISSGKIVKTEEIKFLYGNNIKSLNDEAHYKYLDILQAVNIKVTEVKMKVRNEYIRRVKKRKSKLNGRNTIKGITTSIIPVNT